MLARLQRVGVFLWCFWVATALMVIVWGPEPGVAWAWLALGLQLGAPLVWFAFSYAVMRQVVRQQGQVPLHWGAYLRAWAAELVAAVQVFAWRQPFRSEQPPDYLPPTASGRVGVVLVHGYLCNRGVWADWLQELQRRGVPCVAVNLEPVFGSIDDYAPAIDAAVLRLQAATGRRPWVLGHSMGGVAIRAWLRARQADERIRGWITVAAPHQGTWIGQFSTSRNGRQVRMGSPWLAQLQQAEPAERRARCYNLYSDGDAVVYPAAQACLPDAHNELLPGLGHVEMVQRPDVLHRVLAHMDVGLLSDRGACGRAVGA